MINRHKSWNYKQQNWKKLSKIRQALHTHTGRYRPNVHRWSFACIQWWIIICRKLYWVDSRHKTLNSVNVATGTGRTSVSLSALVGSGHIFGLAISGGDAYVSCWKSNASMIRVQLSSRVASVYKFGLSTGVMFSNVYVASAQQPSGLLSFHLSTGLLAVA